MEAEVNTLMIGFDFAMELHDVLEIGQIDKYMFDIFIDDFEIVFGASFKKLFQYISI